MSGKLKEVRERMVSVNNSRQITKAMQAVSIAKLRKSQEAIVQLRPYAKKLQAMLAETANHLGEFDNIQILKRPTPIKNVIVIAITSDKGLCGAFNMNICKLVNQHVQQYYPNKHVTILNMGKKGKEMLHRMGRRVDDRYLDLEHSASLERIEACVQELTTLFLQGEVDAVDIAYSRFKNAAVQIPTIEPMLPFATNKEGEQENAINADYIFEQSPTFILESLIPQTLRIQLLKSILDTVASEHGARMSAMDKATENANEIYDQLKITYNRARQAAITTELSEIIAGATAL